MTQPALFPFSALLGQAQLQQALLLVAIDPGIGGVLIEGPRGTAKSTSARALAELLPAQRFITLPLGASEEQLIGTVDIEAALQGGNVAFAPGLLAKAHDGVLYVDEVNLLPDALVDQLLDVAASGINVIERDGISHSHPARFVLIGTMNREEGELRPQLLDRFGLALTLQNYRDANQRQAIVKARLAFDLDAAAFRAGFAAEQQQLIARIQQARATLSTLNFSDAVHERVSRLCIAAGVDGMRADLVMLRAARALAALQQDNKVTVQHVDAVAELALTHRRNENAQADQPQAPANSQQHSRGDDTAAETPRDAAQTDAAKSGATDAENPWGAMPAPASIAALPVKGVKPLPPKKR
jgi:magnesium chelatase subunit I